MAKLYFKYGAMGSSKTANALITKFNYEERGMRVWLIKPSLDDRDGADVVRSRIGLAEHAYIARPETDLFLEYSKLEGYHAVIADECQFFTAVQVNPYSVYLLLPVILIKSTALQKRNPLFLQAHIWVKNSTLKL